MLPPINNARLLKAKIEMVEMLGNIELASRVIDTKQAAFQKHLLRDDTAKTDADAYAATLVETFWRGVQPAEAP